MKREIHGFELTLSSVVMQLHLIIFGAPQSSHFDPATNERLKKWGELGYPYLAGMDVEFEGEMNEREAPWGRSLIVKPVGWPKGSRVICELILDGNVMVGMLENKPARPQTPLIGQPLGITVHIPGLFSELKIGEWSLVPPYFFRVSSPKEEEMKGRERRIGEC